MSGQVDRKPVRSVKVGIPNRDDLEGLSLKLGGSWQSVARRLRIPDEQIDTIALDHRHQYSHEKGYAMLRFWKQTFGREATYKTLYDALSHEFVHRQDLADEFCLTGLSNLDDNNEPSTDSPAEVQLVSGTSVDNNSEKKADAASGNQAEISQRQNSRKWKILGPSNNAVIFTKHSFQELSDEQHQYVDELLTQHIQGYIKHRKLSTDEGVSALIAHTLEAYNLVLESLGLGCLELKFRCPSLESLERLWSDYQSGHLNDIAERYLVTDDIKKKLNLETVRLKTTIEEENYQICKKILMEKTWLSNLDDNNEPSTDSPADVQLVSGTSVDDNSEKKADAASGNQAEISQPQNSRKWKILGASNNADAVITTYEGSKESQIEDEYVHVPTTFKGYVIGMGGRVIKNIQQESGARVVAKPKNEDGFTVTGNEEQRACARKLILQKVDGAIMTHKESQFNKDCYLIDGWNLPVDCQLKLEQIAKEDGIDLPESIGQYRIKPAKFYDAKESCCSNDDPSYMSKLENDTLESLRRIKREMETKKQLKADMWCHFGMFIIRLPYEGDEAADEEFTIEEASSKLQKNRWRGSFKGGVNLNEKILKDHLHAFDKTPVEYKEYSSRYDLTFVLQNGRQIFFRMWATKRNLGKRLEDIPLPSRDLKNVLEEIHFKDELTRSRCRGWLLLPLRRYIRADILFPGCDFDCRLTITGHNDSAFELGHLPSEKTTRILASYLSEVTFADEDDFGLRLPKRNIPDGFQLSHMRCCERSLYGFMSGFTIVLSKEISRDIKTLNSKVSTAFYLLCDEWEELLHKGGWEPETVVKKLPDFLQFVKKVQSLVVCEMKQTGLSPTIPAEIRARGPSALEAYNKALADGKTSVKRVPIMLIGQDRAGKTSLKKSLRGICFDPKEDSTVGIDVDPSHFKVTTETWKTGTTEKGQNPDAAISFDRHAAMLVVENLKRDVESFLLEDSLEENESTLYSEITEIPKQPGPNETPKDAKHVEIPSETRDTLSEDAHQVPPRPSRENAEVPDRFAPWVPEDVAVATETFLQGGWEDGRRHIYSTLWDFSGQSVYYVTHPLFLTARAIYCLVYDLSLNPDDMAPPLVKQGVYEPFPEDFSLKTNLDYLDFWMRSVASLASLDENGGVFRKSEGLPKKLPAVFLVCTHADTPYDKRDPRHLAYKVLGYLRKKPSYGSHLFGVFVVDNTKSGTESECQEIVRLRQEVLALAKKLPHTKESIPIKWLKFDKTLNALREKENKWISLESAKVIASKDCDINDREFETLMNYLHDLRSLVHFDDSPTLSKLVVLDPQWLIDLFKKVITVQPAYECKEEKFLPLWYKLEEEGILDEQLLTHMWEPLLGDRDTYDSLVDIMEKFSLLCRWPSGTSETKSYLVPSMLRSHPPDEIVKLLASAKLPSLFLKFESGHVPPGLFPRLVLKFFQCGELWKQAKSKMFHNFARFFSSDDENCSVILLCHSSSVEIVVHKANPTLALAGEQSSVMALSTGFPYHTVATEVTCAGAVRRRLDLMMECMRNEFSWLKDIKYEMRVLCPVCCNGRAVNYCPTHKKLRCKEEQCLHFLSISKLFNDNGSKFCDRSAAALDTQVLVMQFSHWYDLSRHQLAIGERDRRSSGEGNEEKSIALPDMVSKSLLLQSCDSKEIVNQFKESLKLSQASLKTPDDETKKWIRCLAREANVSDRLDVVKSLRNISPAGTTGPLLPEILDVREIPIEKGRQLTMALSGGDDWKVVAEKLGLEPFEIRFFDRFPNPADAVLSYVAHQRFLTVGDLYDVLAACDFPLIADDL